MQSKILNHLLEETWKSPVFGDSFGTDISLKSNLVLRQINDISANFTTEISKYITRGMPELTLSEVDGLVKQIAPKTVGFCPALVAGDLDDPQRLQAVAVAIGLMYWGDQTMDRGDEAMPLAIEQLGGQNPAVPAHLASTVNARLSGLQYIALKIRDFAFPEDAPYVQSCFDEQVLVNEVQLHRLSQAFEAVTDKEKFMATHGATIANQMVIDAGFPSVSSSLYAIYRQHDPSLPPLSAVYGNPAMQELLQICNAVVRIADELGDWETDAGHHPEWGGFCLNLLNQPHPALIDAFLRLACVKEPDLTALRHAFTNFHNDDESRRHYGELIIQVFMRHIKTYILALPGSLLRQHGLYVTLCKRVLEIGYINRIGDIALGQEKPQVIS